MNDVRDFSMKFYSIIMVVLLGLLSGCGGNDTKSKSPLNGFWYQSEQDLYVEFNSGNFITYSCSVNDGYIREESAPYREEGSNLILENPKTGKEETSAITLENDKLTLEFTPENGETIKIVFESKDSLPEQCYGNAIVLTYVSPMEVVEGVEVIFTANFDYRVTTSESNIELGLSIDESGKFGTAGSTELAVTKAETGSGSLTIKGVPQIFENGSHFYLHVIVTETAEKQGASTVFASDKQLIKVTPSSE